MIYTSAAYEYSYCDDDIVLPTDVTKKGYKFIGWKNDENGRMETKVSSRSIGDKTYTAQWLINDYKISYDLAGGRVEDNANPTEYTIETESFTLVAPVKTGYTFEGRTGTDIVAMTQSVTIENGTIGDKSYTANWKEIPVPTVEPTQAPTVAPTVKPTMPPFPTFTVKPSIKPTTEATVEPVETPEITAGVIPTMIPVETPVPSPVYTVVKVPSTKLDASSTFVLTSINTGKKTVTIKTVKQKNEKIVVIPDYVKYNGKTYKVTGISANAFKNNKKINTVKIGSSVKSIGENAFYGCKNLKSITFRGSSIKITKNAFKGIAKKCVIKVPKNKLKAYKKLLKKANVSKTVVIKAFIRF